MPYRKNVFAKDEVYHLYNRGAGKQPIFFGADNYVYCLRLLKKYRDECQIQFIAYCLMPNHYHFVLRQNGDAPLSDFIQIVFNAYTQAVNRQQGRSGTLFEGRFKHVHVDNTAYLLHLCRYVHLNPVAAQMVDSPEQWLYSNFAEWIGERQGTLIDRAFIESFLPERPEGSESSGRWYARFVKDHQADKVAQTQIAKYLFDEEQPTLPKV